MSKKGMLMTSDLAEKTHKRLKTVTRRLIKPQPTMGYDPHNMDLEPGDVCFDPMTKKVFRLEVSRGRNKAAMGELTPREIKPRYQPGDIVSIKETHWRWGKWVKNGLSDVGRQKWRFHAWAYHKPIVFAKPDRPKVRREKLDYHKISPLFLPYDLARTHVEILSVRPEKLQKITEEDSIAEGIRADMVDSGGQNQDGSWIDVPDHLGPFIELWDSINSKTYPWELNPFVWRYEYKRVEKRCEKLK